MIALLKTHVFLLAGLAMGILNLAIVVPQVITFDVFFSWFRFCPMHIWSPALV
jgi:hypothetical protein